MAKKQSKRKKLVGLRKEELDTHEESNTAVADLEPERIPSYKMGRPRAFDTERELRDACEDYLEWCKEFRQIPNKAGLAVHFCVSQETVREYGKKPEFSGAVKWINGQIENFWVQNLARPHAAGTIFYLKNAFGYQDRTETDITSGGKVITYTIPSEIAVKHGIAVAHTEGIEAPKPKEEDKDTAM